MTCTHEILLLAAARSLVQVDSKIVNNLAWYFRQVTAYTALVPLRLTMARLRVVRGCQKDGSLGRKAFLKLVQACLLGTAIFLSQRDWFVVFHSSLT